MLPHSSVIVHVRVILNSTSHSPGSVLSSNVNTGVLQLSPNAGVPKTGVSSQAITSSGTKPSKNGSVVSSIVTTLTTSLELPHSSVAV